LASGILSGKYAHGVPKGSRLESQAWLREKLTPEIRAVVDRLAPVALGLDCSLAQLAIAWCLKNPNVSTVILGATSGEQLKENLGSLAVRERLNSEIMTEIESIIASARK
jgi:aryl-alcohol dehydrogenase-like predicted oxidoreductase